MQPDKVKKQLTRMLDSFTPGSVLMLLGEVLARRADEARRGGSEAIAESHEEAVATMNVVGLGLDAILPKPKMR